MLKCIENFIEFQKQYCAGIETETYKFLNELTQDDLDLIEDWVLSHDWYAKEELEKGYGEKITQLMSNALDIQYAERFCPDIDLDDLMFEFESVYKV